MKITPGSVTVCGAPEGWDAHYLAELIGRVGEPVLHIARDDARAAAMAEALSIFAPELPVLTFPAWDCLPYDRVSPNPEIAAARMATLAALADGFDRPAVLLTTLNAASQRIPTPETVSDASFIAEASQQIDIDGLITWLTGMGYNRASTVIEAGDFAVRGGIIDIFPPGERNPVRLDFFGDVLESARRFDAESQRTLETIGRVELAPASEIIMNEGSITSFRRRYREIFGAARLDDPLYAAVSEGRKHQGMEHWLPLFHETLGTIFDFLPHATVTLDAQVDEALGTRVEMVADHYDARHEALEMAGKHDVPYRPLTPDMLYLDRDAWQGALG
ncbi:MAG: transcription-repair coupling factor, partial [Pseudomonadota bacterium]